MGGGDLSRCQGMRGAPHLVVVVDQAVGTREQPVERRPVAGVREVEHNGFLVGVEIGEQRAFALPERPHAPCARAARRFDLDHLGPEIGEQLGRVFTGGAPGDLDDGQAF